MKSVEQYQILALDILSQLKLGDEKLHLNPTWTALKEPERLKLAHVFFDEGTELITQGEAYAFHIFDVSRRIAPTCAKLQCKQGRFLFEYAKKKKNEKYLFQAQKHMQQALELDNSTIDAWILLGDINLVLFKYENQQQFLVQADLNYSKAYSLASQSPRALMRFLPSWALSWHLMGNLSKEALDYKKAIDKYEKAAQLGCSDTRFWCNFANSWFKLGDLIADTRLLQKALTYFQKAIDLDPHHFKSWLGIARSYHDLFLLSLNSNHLAQAHSAYTKAADINRDYLKLWIYWGKLFLVSGQKLNENQHLQMSLMKFSKALELSCDHVVVKSLHAKANALLGHNTNRLDLLKQAQVEAQEACNKDTNCSLAWAVHGHCEHLLGLYFQDSKYFLEAIEKYKQALILSKRSIEALKGISDSFFELGKINNDIMTLHNATQYYEYAAKENENDFEIYNSWGQVLMYLADILDDQESVSDAIEKFESALKYNVPKSHKSEILFHYGTALDLLASYESNPELYEKAITVLESVLKIDSAANYVHTSLALSYSHLAEATDEVDFYGKSIENFHLALIEDPEDDFLWDAWGLTLLNFAQLIDDPVKKEMSDRLLMDAEKKLRHAIALGHIEAHYHLTLYYCLTSDLDLAMQSLHLAHQKGALPDLNEMLYDSKLEALRQTTMFQDFINSYALGYKDQEL